MHRRQQRETGAPIADQATGCTCVIHHATTAEEQDKVLDSIVHARNHGEHNLIPHLMERLNSQNCRAMRRGAM